MGRHLHVSGLGTRNGRRPAPFLGHPLCRALARDATAPEGERSATPPSSAARAQEKEGAGGAESCSPTPELAGALWPWRHQPLAQASGWGSPLLHSPLGCRWGPSYTRQCPEPSHKPTGSSQSPGRLGTWALWGTWQGSGPHPLKHAAGQVQEEWEARLVTANGAGTVLCQTSLVAGWEPDSLGRGRSRSPSPGRGTAG